MHCPLGGLSLRKGLGPFCCACQTTVCIVAHSPLGACPFAGALGLSAALSCLSFGLLFVSSTFAGALGLASACFGSLVSVRITTLRCSLLALRSLSCLRAVQPRGVPPWCKPGCRSPLLTRSSGLAMTRRACSALLLLISKPLRVG